MEARSDPIQSAKSHFFDTSGWAKFCKSTSTSMRIPPSSQAVASSSSRRPDRPSSIVTPNRNSANNNSTKKKWRRRPAAAAPPSRPVQVGRRQSALESAPPRARVGAARRGDAVQSTRLSISGVGGVDPVARSLRSPERHRRPEPEELSIFRRQEWLDISRPALDFRSCVYNVEFTDQQRFLPWCNIGPYSIEDMSRIVATVLVSVQPALECALGHRRDLGRADARPGRRARAPRRRLERRAECASRCWST